jgi:hypothetical protein
MPYTRLQLSNVMKRQIDKAELDPGYVRQARAVSALSGQLIHLAAVQNRYYRNRGEKPNIKLLNEPAAGTSKKP